MKDSKENSKNNNCCDCLHHEIIEDPDPDDWFCDDDVAVVCKITKNKKRDQNSKHKSNHSEFRAITIACRPYNIKKECSTPTWCPLRVDSNIKADSKQSHDI